MLILGYFHEILPSNHPYRKIRIYCRCVYTWPINYCEIDLQLVKSQILYLGKMYKLWGQGQILGTQGAKWGCAAAWTSSLLVGIDCLNLSTHRVIYLQGNIKSALRRPQTTDETCNKPNTKNIQVTIVWLRKY